MKKHLPTHIFRWIVLSIFLFCAVLSDAGSISTLTGTEWLIYELNNPYFICLGTGLLASANTNQEQGQYTPSWYVFYDLQIDGIPELYFEDCMVFSAIDGRYVEPRMTTRQLMEMQ